MGRSDTRKGQTSRGYLVHLKATNEMNKCFGLWSKQQWGSLDNKSNAMEGGLALTFTWFLYHSTGECRADAEEFYKRKFLKAYRWTLHIHMLIKRSKDIHSIFSLNVICGNDRHLENLNYYWLGKVIWSYLGVVVLKVGCTKRWLWMITDSEPTGTTVSSHSCNSKCQQCVCVYDQGIVVSGSEVKHGHG